MISLLSADVARDPEGLCSAKFRADCLTRGIDYAFLRVGDVVTVGGRTLVITRVGKRCHPQCALVRDGRVCALKNNCAFAEIYEKDGLSR